MSDSRPIVGVLAVQGDFAEHEAALHRVDLATRQIRRPPDLDGIAGLVLPGGESTTMLRLMDIQGLTEPIRAYLADDRPVLATCAGLILLATEVVDPPQRSFAHLDIKVARNGYGRQIHSGTVALVGADLPTPATGIFIRAPRVLAVGPDTEVLARRADDPVLLRKGNTLAACFHPELEPHHFLTRMFEARVRPTLTK